MSPYKILAAAFILSPLNPALLADDIISAQPITLSPLVGNEQRDFFITSKRGDDYVVFDGAVPLKPSRGVQRESRVLYSVKIGIPGTFYDTVGKLAPLKKLAAYTLPAGTVFTNLLQSDISSDESDVRNTYVVPGKGLYITADDGPPRILHPDTQANPITGVALRFPGNLPTDSTASEQFRVIFGGTDAHKGSEPFQSTGTSSGKLLADILPGKPGSTPNNFVTNENDVYFLATSATSSQFQDLFKVTVNTSGRKPVYSVANLSHGNLSGISNLVSGGATGLFFNNLDSGTNYLVNSADGINYNYLQTSGTSSEYVIDASDLTPSINNPSGDFAFSSYDIDNSAFRFSVYNSFNEDVSFPEDSNASGVATKNPYDITSTGNYYYFGATVNGFSRIARYFTGGTDLEYITTQSAGNYLSNLGEIVDVPSGTSGTLYFTADALVDSVQQQGILFSMDPDNANPVATPVRTVSGNTVKGAHNLGSVDNNVIFRCYFSAPVNSGTNSEYATGGTDYGTKPWVVNAP